jgi:hypothetical protein
LRCALVSLLLAAAGGASARAATPAVAVLDLRPVHAESGATNLDQLPEAARLSSAVRSALSEHTGVKLSTVEELRSALGPTYRVQQFKCRESANCLEPIVRPLSAQGIRFVLFGTVTFAPHEATVRWFRFDLELRRSEAIGWLAIDRDRPVDPSLVTGKLVAFLPQPEETPPPLPPPRPTPAPPVPPPPPPTPASGEVVEVLGETETPAPPPKPAISERLQAGGWARQSVELNLDDNGFHRDAPDPTALPLDALVTRTQLLLGAHYQRSNQYELVASGSFELAIFEQVPASPTLTFNGFNGQAERSSAEASLRELFVGRFWKRFDLRVGQQRVAWGRADVVSPNDVVNARDLRNPVLSEPELVHIPTFVVRGDVDLDPFSLEIVFAPFFVPDRFDVAGSNWAVVQPSAPAPYRGFLNLLGHAFDPSLFNRVQALFSTTQLPADDFTDPSVGVRLGSTGHRVDLNAYYHYGFDGTPTLRLDPMFAQALAEIDFRTARYSDLAPVLQLLDQGRHPFAATFVRRHHVGIDAVAPLGPFALRLDAAVQSEKVFYQRDLVGFTSPVVLAVASVEYQTGDIGKTVLLEALYVHLFDNVPAPGLLGYTQDTLGFSLVARWSLANGVRGELRGFVGVQPATFVLRPQLGYAAGAFTIDVGALLLGGDPFSFGDYFGRNTTVYAVGKYAF